MLWGQRNNALLVQMGQAEAQLRAAVGASEASYQSTGPAEAVSDTAQYFVDQAALWKRSSALMGAQAEQAGFQYFHFLQPNQYVANSKVFTDEELEVAINPVQSPYKTAVEKGYQQLMDAGAKLPAQGVQFMDLTPLFREEARSVYNDQCCHFNDLGYRLIAEAIGERVAGGM